MVGTRWPLEVTCASLLALDTLAEVAADGNWNGVHLRLDDAWQGGGLWRAELLDTATPVNADPAIALGLGWVVHTGGEINRLPPDELDSLGGMPEGADDEDELEWNLVDSEVTWTVHLSNADLDKDRLRMPGRIVGLVRAALTMLGQGQVLVAFRHDGEAERRDWSPLDDDGHLCVVWPLGIWAGTTVRVTWPFYRAVITAATCLLAVAEEVADIVYTHEFNLAVALAAAGLGERSSRTASISQLVRAVVRRHGSPTEDGAVALPLDDVVLYCFGPSGEVVPGYGPDVLRRAVFAAVSTMSAAGAARLDADLVVVEDRLTGAGRRADAELLARFVDANAKRLRQEARRHFVPATVVTLPDNWRRSQAKDDEWAEVAGTDYLPDGQLAANQTWRRRHVRGSATDPALRASLERFKRVVADLGATEEVTTIVDDFVANPFADPSANPPDPPASLQTDENASQDRTSPGANR